MKQAAGKNVNKVEKALDEYEIGTKRVANLIAFWVQMRKITRWLKLDLLAAD